jgi:uncharacterized RDD family membrane protein YckC
MKCPKCNFTSFDHLSDCKKCGYVFVKSIHHDLPSSLTLPVSDVDVEKGKVARGQEKPDISETVASIKDSLDEIGVGEHEDVGSIPQEQAAQAGSNVVQVQGAGADAHETKVSPSNHSVNWEESISLSNEELNIDMDDAYGKEGEKEGQGQIGFKLKEEESDVSDTGRERLREELGKVGDELKEIEEEPASQERSSDMSVDLSMVEKGGFLRRLVAFTIDFVVLYIVDTILMIIGFLAMGVDTSGLGEGGIEQIRVLLPFYFFIFIINIAYYTYFHGNTGQTPGKMICKLKVVRVNGEPLGYGRAFLRWVGYLASWAAFALGFLWVIFDRQKQAWHDKIAGSYVLKL